MLIDDATTTALQGVGPDGASLRRRLREESRESHARLDLMFEGMASAADPGAYRHFLAVNEACHRVIEPILDASPLPSALPCWRPADRRRALRADLTAMGVPPLEPSPFAIPEPDLAEAVGIAYVIEGSRLGAGVILQRLRRQALGPAWAGASFAYLEAPDAPHLLRRLLDEAAPRVSAAAAIARCLFAATATFEHFLATEAAARRGAAPAGAGA